MTLRSHTTPPLLIYDGDCGFCTYWVHYWQKLTGDKVSYLPYQDVAQDYPSVSIEEFQRAVQYVAPDGTIARAAEASFLTLSHAPGKSFWLALYRRLPGFAFFSERSYAFIAAHRDFFYRLSLLFYGKNYEPPHYDLISWIFLRALGIVFLIAFVSFGVQALGLIGSQGIIPISELVQAARDQLGWAGYWFFPMLFYFNSSDFAVQITCWGGALLSLLLIFNIWPRINLVVLYVLYLSLCSAGQMFMSFQWDMYLLETGLIAIILLTSQTLGIWLLRWLLFRFMFGGGIVKLLSGDPTWRDFTALSYYFMTEPLPTPLAWYASNLPQQFLKAATASALFIELFVPFLIFFPRRLRFISAFFILFLQTLILITGNYNFFNILTILLCLVLFDDAAVSKILPQRFTRFISSKPHIIAANKILTFMTYVFAVFTIFISLVQFYLRFGYTTPAPLLWVVDSVTPLRFVNTYGPFAIITTRRMEIIIEGSNDEINWSEYSFKYKPGDVTRPLRWNIPHQPRLDWQMWFAALGTVQSNPWFLRVMERLLQNSPPVVALLENNPFPDKPPQFLRALFYEYNFTTSEEREKTGAVWKRQLTGFYLSSVHLR
ncbi:MAG: lipase maturation factor family protein [Gammaproteobacteria bacterium]